MMIPSFESPHTSYSGYFGALGQARDAHCSPNSGFDFERLGKKDRPSLGGPCALLKKARGLLVMGRMQIFRCFVVGNHVDFTYGFRWASVRTLIQNSDPTPNLIAMSYSFTVFYYTCIGLACTC